MTPEEIKQIEDFLGKIDEVLGIKCDGKCKNCKNKNKEKQKETDEITKFLDSVIKNVKNEKNVDTKFIFNRLNQILPENSKTAYNFVTSEKGNIFMYEYKYKNFEIVLLKETCEDPYYSVKYELVDKKECVELDVCNGVRKYIYICKS